MRGGEREGGGWRDKERRGADCERIVSDRLLPSDGAGIRSGGSLLQFRVVITVLAVDATFTEEGQHRQD